MAKSTPGKPGSTPGKMLSTTKTIGNKVGTPKSTSKMGGSSSVSSAIKKKSTSKKWAAPAAGAAGDEKRWHPLPVRLDFGSAFTRHIFLRAPTKGRAGVPGTPVVPSRLI
jgi:hypothetical protein